MGVIDVLAAVGERFPAVRKPERKPTLYRRLAWTGVILVLYFIMSNIPLYGIPPQNIGGQVDLQRIIFASSAGTLMELGIGPIVTASLIIQVLVGAKIIKLDLADPEGRRKFTSAQKVLALAFAALEAVAFTVGGRYWVGTAIEPGPLDYALVSLQLFLGALLVIYFDEVMQKGWGIGSAISLFILAGVAQGVVWSIFGTIPGVAQDYGLVPAIISNPDLTLLARPNGFPDLTGFFTTLAAIILLVYLQAMRVEIPITSERFKGIRSRVPLQFIYVTNIPILLVGILVSDLLLVQRLLADYLGVESRAYQIYSSIVYYLSPPRGVVQSIADPVKTAVFIASWTVLSIVFGYMWVEIAGLNPREQAERLIKGGLAIPGMRSDPRVLERVLRRYIYPLTFLSSLIVAALVIVADIFGAYGTGTGLLLAVGIINQYYAMITRERALETYPLLRRILGEEVV
ncbi:preprotein translocase SecY subunit [Aeropyrum pernix K1]|uniref:Protein translocase subunit SecY n=1 Tax=Aeropyrum pernix (strain ATCC 700893 / DSM 11879 / JCM 9820 / NBRC 100138 / K1) TaxID=272557 RepID=SECY_AERPE|nr:preprotein translocase subunit SecY [Aeropyrum pernix]Q9YDD0.2 RecName: Full=Protein translocase subunit SecY; AltName: Full=Protein transport protein SEC61 subunit alpha homolog [Aeropyrum pernix K1]BAA79967.2 preprotein translocase SecY subunit [Aeropyrum pernix K1]